MIITEANHTEFCCNVMEALVNQEIEKQLPKLQPKLARYINKIEVMTYAMNRLPALYASSQKGWNHQMLRAKKEFGNQVTVVVRQALAAVQRDPLRVEIPLKPKQEVESQAALDQLKILLQDEQLTWSNLASVVEQTLIKTSQGEITWKSKRHMRSLVYKWEDTCYHT